jgi:hypothetical protein
MHQFTKSVGPYTFVSKEETRSFETPDGIRTFRFLIYGAYNAMGLIGSEKNGIAILDEDKVTVLCDEIAKEISGYQQPSPRALRVFDAFLEADWEMFQVFISRHSRSRYTI